MSVKLFDISTAFDLSSNNRFLNKSQENNN